VSRPQIPMSFARCFQACWPVVVSFAWAAAVGLLCRKLTRDGTDGSAIWLVNGFILSLLLTADVKHRYKILAGAAAGILASAGLAGEGFWMSAGRTPAHVFEIWLAAKLLGWGPIRAADLAQPRLIARFIFLGVLVPCTAGALLAAVWAGVIGHSIPWSRLSAVWAAHSLGMASMAPAGIVLLGPDIRRLIRRDRLGETLVWSAVTIAVSALVFSQSTYPLLFIVVTPVLVVAFRGGFGGVALAVLATVAVATGFTLAGKGPLTLIPDSTLAMRIHLLQGFVAWLLLTMFPVVVVVSEHRRAYRSLAQMKDKLRLLADYSSDVIILTDLEGRRLFVSPSVEQVLGWQPAAFLEGTFRDLADPETVSSIALQLEELRRDQGATTIVVHARRADGSQLWLESRVQYFRDMGFAKLSSRSTDALPERRRTDEGFVIILRDISKRRAAEVALERAHAKLESLAWKDGLTDLSNRRRFDDVLADEWSQAVAASAPIALLMMDVDHFKAYNDRYGHQQGDKCLTAVAAAIAESCYRDSDVACRYGGEEFAVIVPRASLEQAQLIAERIRGAVEKLNLPHEGSAFGRVTLSIGVAGCTPLRSGAEDALIAAADMALYASKDAGRNAVFTSPDAQVLGAVGESQSLARAHELVSPKVHAAAAVF
jgi:diguanylate cyclase (GGDEF)-like protein/PAS domain S-box-containing protein